MPYVLLPFGLVGSLDCSIIVRACLPSYSCVPELTEAGVVHGADRAQPSGAPDRTYLLGDVVLLAFVLFMLSSILDFLFLGFVFGTSDLLLTKDKVG